MTEAGKFDTTLANVYYENKEGATEKGSKWIRFSVRFGSDFASALGKTKSTNVVFVQIFTRKDTGAMGKDSIVQELTGLFNYQTLTNNSGIIQFGGGTEVIAPEDGGYVQHQYSIPFDHTQEI